LRDWEGSGTIFAASFWRHSVSLHAVDSVHSNCDDQLHIAAETAVKIRAPASNKGRHWGIRNELR
jgi:hypothetical protein